MMMRGAWLVVGVALVACGREAGSGKREAGRAAAGATASATGNVQPAQNVAGALPPNRMGRIPVLEYHVVGDSTRGEFIISRDKFQHDLQLLYDRGYRPITVAQLVDKDFSDVPAGMSPVVFTFDDASPEQFSYIEQDGKLEVDPKTVIGMWVAFNQKHPDW